MTETNVVQGGGIEPPLPGSVSGYCRRCRPCETDARQNWFREEESNLHDLDQSQADCHYIIPECSVKMGGPVGYDPTSPGSQSGILPLNEGLQVKRARSPVTTGHRRSGDAGPPGELGTPRGR